MINYKYTFMELIVDVFKIEKRPLTYTEIWEHAEKHQLDKKINSIGKTPWDTIGARLYVDIRDNPKTIFVKVSSKPTKFYLKNENYVEPNDSQSPVSKTKYDERNLHPILVYFLNKNEYFNANAKTIFHEISVKTEKGKNEWIHPDVVAFNLPYLKYGNVLELAKLSGLQLFRVFSFELKKELNFSNYKEYYFQAVSNSSWAHEGYLVIANDLSLEKEFVQELNRLSNSYGIGIIHLNLNDPLQSKILISAKEKTELDLETMHMLSGKNKNFNDFLTSINDSLARNKKIVDDFDEVYSEEKMTTYLTTFLKK